ncbi:MAG: metallophosphoesterase family protein [Candidatus Doudnabacteria bacterium]
MSDTHFHHSNIIKYCKRPFHDVFHMDEVLYKNWIKTVKKDDEVYFLGDLTLKNTAVMLQTLPGQITFIRGNHDRKRGYENVPYLIMDIRGYKCLLVHNPRNKIVDQYINEVDFVLHGHVHNIPFEAGNKFVNLSVEVIGYKPLPLSKLLGILSSKIN